MLHPRPLLRFNFLPNPFPLRFPPIPNGRRPFSLPVILPINFKSSRLLHPSSYSTDNHSNSAHPSQFDLDLDLMMAVLPEDKRRMLADHRELGDLIEVVIDLGRKPLARFPSGDFVLSDQPITMEDIQHAISQVGDFAVDNRAGISRTLHRISAIRNRKGKIIGLTCRVGRALHGSADSLRDLVKDGASLLLIGPPGVGKTTIIRDIARMLANDYKKRVMIVDTSNEIGGDGDIPHVGIGNARRMQVPHADEQHKVLIEAVENHMPQVIVIDEIGTKLEASAASTIAQRGIQLVATAHGVTIENLVMNPALEMLVGGVQSVTLGDEEASRRRVQKTVLERKGPSPFSCGVEIINKAEVRVHRYLEVTVDALLQGRRPNFEVRRIYQQLANELSPGQLIYDSSEPSMEAVLEDTCEMEDGNPSHNKVVSDENLLKDQTALCIFLYGISEASMIQGMNQLKINVSVEFTDNISEADALIALQSKLRKNPQLQAAAKSRGIPTYASKANSLAQISKAIQVLMSDYADGFESYGSNVKANDAEKTDALEEARIAIEQTVIPRRVSVDLLPRASNILLLQKDLIRKYNLQSERVVSELGLQYIRILPLKRAIDEDSAEFEDADADDDRNIGNFNWSKIENNGSSFAVDRLPLLPD